MFRFTPKTEDELDQSGLLEKGVYDFTVDTATSVNAKTDGTPMLKLGLTIYGPDGEHKIFDNLHPKLEFKIRHFCDSIGILKVYETGQIDPGACEGRSGKAKVDIESAKGDFPAKNNVRDYVPRVVKEVRQAKVEPVVTDGADDGSDVPW